MNYEVVADESVDFRVVTELQNIGITVYSIAEEIPTITDKSVLLIAFEREAILIIEDKNFGELVFRLQLPHHGVLLIRIKEASYKISSVAAPIKQHYSLSNIIAKRSISFQ